MVKGLGGVTIHGSVKIHGCRFIKDGSLYRCEYTYWPDSVQKIADDISQFVNYDVYEFWLDGGMVLRNHCRSDGEFCLMTFGIYDLIKLYLHFRIKGDTLCSNVEESIGYVESVLYQKLMVCEYSDKVGVEKFLFEEPFGYDPVKALDKFRRHRGY